MTTEESAKKKHPKALYTLFATEMWERFSYYGMRALLTLYLTAELIDGGFGLDREAALGIYALFTGLVYLTPIVGGWVADNFFGKRKTVYIGGFVMAVGQFMIASSAFMSASLPPETRLFIFNLGLGVLIIGNGFFKPNISTIVGDFYDDNDPRKDAAFNIFYMGINLGAILGPFIAGALGESDSFGWGYGYLSAGVGMVLGVLWLKMRERTLDQKGLPPNSAADKFVLDAKDWRDIIIYSIGLVISTFIVVYVWGILPDSVTSIITYVGFAAGIIGLGYIIFKGTNGTEEWTRMIVILVLAFFNIAFWAGFEQAGGTMSLFAKESTDRFVFGWEVPATWFQNVNPIAILILAPIFSVLWLKLDALKFNPRTPLKFAIGLFLGAIAFWVMTLASSSAEGGNMVSPWWLVAVYLILTLGELMLSPIGLSMITKLAPTKLGSVVMGLWMASFAAGNYLAGMLESILTKYNFELYPFIMWLMIGSGVSLLVLSPLLNKFMKGIH